MAPGIPSAAEAMCASESVPPDTAQRAHSVAGFAKWREIYDSLETLSV